MKNKMINEVHIEGILYEHDLELRTTGENSKNPGTEYIRGTVSIATDDACTNIVPIHYTYVTERTSKGNTNATFGVLKNIIDGNIKTMMGFGRESAAMVRADTSIGVNDFYSDRSGEETLVSAKRNEGGFIHTTDSIADDEKNRNWYKADMVIYSVTHQDADEERNIPEKAIIKGFTFDFRNALLPIEVSAVQPGAIAWAEGLNASQSEPVFTWVRGRQISETIVREIREESAFGDDIVREVRSNHREWIVTGAQPDPYVWDDEGSITAEELRKALADRETYLATVKQRNDEWKATRNNASAAAPAAGGFNF